MLRHNIIFIIVLLMLSSMALASTPVYEKNDQFDDAVYIGDNDYGDMVFIGRGYQSEVHQRVDFSPFAAQQFDIIRWESSTTARIKKNDGTVNQFLTQSSEYYITTPGQYRLENAANSSVGIDFQVTVADVNEVRITEITEPSGIDVDMSPKTFVLQQNQATEVDVDIFVENDVLPDTYTYIYEVNGVSHSMQLEVGQTKNWTIEEETINSSFVVKNGQTINIGYVFLKNIGNVDVDINSGKYGNASHMIGVPGPQKLYRKNTLRMDYQLQIPITQDIGQYHVVLNLSGADIYKELPINITVLDSVKPTIESINISSKRVNVNSTITALATDNTKINNVTVTYDSKTYTMTKDGNYYRYGEVFNKLSRYVFDVCAYDVASNVNCVKYNMTFEKATIIDGYDKSVKMPTKQVGKFSIKEIFEITESLKTPVRLQLINFVPGQEMDNFTEYVIRLSDEQGQVYVFSEYEDTVELRNKGKYELEIRVEEIGDYTGTMRFYTPDFAQDLTDMFFTVGFKEYDIPEEYELEWTNGQIVTCEPYDSGEYDSSYIECPMKYPIDTKRTDLAVPTTFSDRQSFLDDVDAARQQTLQTRKEMRLLVSFGLGIFIVIALSALYLVLIHPYFFMIYETKSKDSEFNPREKQHES